MNRFGVFSITGYPMTKEGERHLRLDYHDPVTTFYVYDQDQACAVIYSSPHEGEARYHAFKLNAEERRSEKEHERLVAGNGHVR